MTSKFVLLGYYVLIKPIEKNNEIWKGIVHQVRDISYTNVKPGEVVCYFDNEKRLFEGLHLIKYHDIIGTKRIVEEEELIPKGYSIISSLIDKKYSFKG